MLDIYELSKRIACSYASSDAYNIVGALRMTNCERYAWEDDTKATPTGSLVSGPPPALKLHFDLGHYFILRMRIRETTPHSPC